MPCNFPSTAYYSSKVNPETGKRSLVFNQRESYKGSATNEFGISLESPLSVPCGKCRGCRADQSLMWSIRAYHESQEHEQNSFVTLTYDADRLPSDGLISKPDLQKFFKRLRSSGVKFRYVACGEYGGQTRRPHYHAIIFGKDWLEGSIPLKESLYTNQSLVDVWGKGIVSIAPVTMASICYVCGYVNKKVDDVDTFNLMSRRPGIGHTWLDKYSDDIARTGVVSIEGRSYQVPKRYLQWAGDELFDVRKDRVLHARKLNRKSDPYVVANQQRARESNLLSKKNSKSEVL